MVTWHLCFFHAQVVGIKNYESVTLVHMVRINKLDVNLAARPETLLDRDAWTSLFVVSLAAYWYFALTQILKNGNF